MDPQRKHAYRWLLYWAMLDIRPLRWAGRGWRERLNPFCWWSGLRRVRVAGGIAEWLHNLALYCGDFDKFDKRPTPEDVMSMHHAAHAQRFIANSVKTDVRCEPVGLPG